MKTIIAVALHKGYWLPEDPVYLPVQAGAAIAGKLPGLTYDDTGDHISGKNPAYSELTALYWLWKNCDADVYGLCHYRRYFAVRRFGARKERILTGEEAERLMDGADVIVPMPRIYAIETNYTQYAHAHRAVDLDLTREVIAECRPESLAAYDRVMKRRWGRRFNMSLMRRAQFMSYCEWLFGVLFEVERRMEAAGTLERDSRVFGYIAERLMDVWLEQTQPRIRQVHVVHLESQHWPGKIMRFLRRKIAAGK